MALPDSARVLCDLIHQFPTHKKTRKMKYKINEPCFVKTPALLPPTPRKKSLKKTKEESRWPRGGPTYDIPVPLFLSARDGPLEDVHQ